MNPQHIADRNVERLLEVAYKPEAIDPAFIREVEERMLTATRRVVHVEPSPVEVARLSRTRRRLSWAMAAAACLALGMLGWYASKPKENRAEDGRPFAKIDQGQPGRKTVEPKVTFLQGPPAPSTGLTPKPRAEVAKPQAVTVGETITTKATERRRVVLADGSVLFVNESSALTYVAPRKLRLDRGEIYLEVAPKTEAERFVVATPDRQVTALGTHFRVAATAAGAGVLVTQGKVKVSDVPDEVPAGQQVAPGQKNAATAPRASYVLDWLKPLVTDGENSLVPGPQHEGGALIAIDPNGQELQLSLRKYHIDVHIEDGFARTTIDQTYFNNTYSRLEGTFYFPLPPDASLSRLAMYVFDGKDCKLMEGGMADRQQAANAYETIRYERRDPALLEWVDGSTFKMRVFPLEAWQEKRIILSYSQRLPMLYGVAKYRFPGGHNMQIVRDWSFEAKVAGAKNWEVLTPSHPDMKRTDAGDALTVRAQAHAVKPEADVVLELREREAPAGGATFGTYLHEGQRYFMARYRPKLDAKPERQRRDWIVLFESSANRDPLLARTQIEVFRNLLKNAEYQDTLTVLRANARTEAFAKPQPAMPANVQAAIEYLEKSHLIGGCDLETALGQAVVLAKQAKNPHIVHLGAGVPSLGEVKDEVLAKLIPESVPYIGVGVGKKWNRAFMKMASDRTGGYFTQINPDEPVAWRAFDLIATLNTPRLLDVRVVDPDEKVAYLTDAVTLAQGEEICAFTRGPADKFAVSSKVLISGRLDGKPFRKEIVVPAGMESRPYEAGYLPRTWAKLEIDRLMADGQDKNKAAITQLSKAMYVMSPFTSLIVLETDADYTRFNIDRGRKDHWAMYACPERIPQVYEPDPYYQRWSWWYIEQPKTGQKPSAEQVCDTILVRLAQQYVYANGRQVYVPPTVTARQLLLATAAYAVPAEFDDMSGKGEVSFNFNKSNKALSTWSFGRNLLRLSDRMDGDFAEIDRLSVLENERLEGLVDREQLTRLGRMRSGWRNEWEGRSAGGRMAHRFMTLAGQPRQQREFFERTRDRMLGERLSEGLFEPEFEAIPGLLARDARGYLGFEAGKPRSFLQTNTEGFRQLSDLAGEELQLPLGLQNPALFDESRRSRDGKARLALETASFQLDQMAHSLDGIALSPRSRETFTDMWMLRLADGVQNRQGVTQLVYSRPQHQLDQRLFGDLTQFAPGLAATMADIGSVLDREAKAEKPTLPGKIDPAAKALIEKARQLGWQALAQPGVGRIPGYKVFVNGQGQFAYERTLSTGLLEQVICDGSTIWNLYPEIGLATRRPFDRFHFGEAVRWAPWLLPRAEELTHNADLQIVNDHTLAIVPIEPPSFQKDKKPAVTRQLQLVFAADGSLAEKRIVETPSGKVLARQTFDSQGNIRLLDEKGKQLAEVRFDRQAAEAPNLAPKLNDLVVLDMPLRTAGFAQARLDKRQQDAKGKLDDAALAADRIAFFAAACLSRDRDVLPIFGAHFHAKGDKRLGFYTLLSTNERHFLNQANSWSPGIATFDPVAEHPGSPLAGYLVQHQKNMNPQHTADADFLENIPGAADSFIGRLASFRNAWNAWRNYLKIGDNTQTRAREYRKLNEYIRTNTNPLFAFLLQSNSQHLNTHERADVAKLVYDTQKEYVEPLGLGYVFGYEAAQAIYYKGDYQQASRLFRDLYTQAMKEDVLPKIDNIFSSALNDQRSSGPNFGEFMRGAVQHYLQKDQPHFAILAATQAGHLGGQTLGDELFQHIAQHLPKKTDNLVLVASLEYLFLNRVDGRADEIRDRLLADKDLAAKPSLWRLSAAIAQQRGQGVKAVTDLEKALDLEYQVMPDMINLEAVRVDYRRLLDHYREIAKAAQTLELKAPTDLTGRVIRAADRWRALDAQSSEVCQRAASILRLLGAKEAAWDYLTTPVALKPNESGPWLEVAHAMQEAGDLQQADDAFVRAYRSERTNPQILWERAQNLLRLGRTGDARALWQQIAEGSWQDRFQQLVPQARWHLEHN